MSLYGVMFFLQFIFSAIVAVYFWNQIKNQRSSRVSFEAEAKKEMDKLKKMQSIKLTVPLTEKSRPTTFDEIIGQSDGIKALKAALCGPNPQHVIIYGPPGIGKTAASRLVLDYAKKNELSPFKKDATFVEIDATTARFDERGIADPLIGSVHDPIYQGAGAYGPAGIPQPKRGAVSNAHGGILFIDEIGELHPIQMNKLLKVLEDRKVLFESAYYSEEQPGIPPHIHEIFKNGLPADFRLVGATTRQPSEISPAIRSRCVEIFFRDLEFEELKKIAIGAVGKINMKVEDKVGELLALYSSNGRDVINLVQLAVGIAVDEGRDTLQKEDVEWIVQNGQLPMHIVKRIPPTSKIGIVNGLGVFGPNQGSLLDLEVIAKPTEWKTSMNITGIIEEETMGTQSKQMKRKSMALGSIENVMTYLRNSLLIQGEYTLHVNFPGGIPVDGPSAGVALAVGIFSAVHQKKVSNTMAFTGEVGIYGDVKPVGGVYAKVKAAQKAGVEKVFIPKANLDTLVSKIEGIEIVPVETMSQVLVQVFGEDYMNSKELMNYMLYDEEDESVISG